MRLKVKKVNQVALLLAEGVAPKDIAPRVPCALSLVYLVRGRRGVARLRHQVAVLEQRVEEINQRVRLLEGKEVDIFDRLKRGA